VPKDYRDAALVGRPSGHHRVISGSAFGLVMSVMLGIGRAIGETMAVMMVTGNAAYIPTFGVDMPFRPVRTMTATIAAEMGEVAQGSMHYHTLFGIGILLFLITFVINSVAGRLVGSQGAARRGGRL
jgi:ABC-type phosphate transport system permease subunit